MKVWHHIVASIVGLSLAGIIVFVVFGNASREGAVQEGAVPGSLRGSGETLCGSITPAAGLAQPARTKAADNQPTIVSAETSREIVITKSSTDQIAWVARVHAASGFCIDEITLDNDTTKPTRITFSTTETVTDAAANEFIAAAIGQTFTQPLRRPRVTVTATVGDAVKTATVSQRAWSAFLAQRKALKLEITMTDLAVFHKRFPKLPMQLKGW